MSLTNHNTPANLSTHCNSGVGICNPRINGDNTPQKLAVFLCLPFVNRFYFEQIIFIMAVLFEQSLWLVAPLSDIANSFNTVTRLFAKSSDGFTTLINGITA